MKSPRKVLLVGWEEKDSCIRHIQLDYMFDIMDLEVHISSTIKKWYPNSKDSTNDIARVLRFPSTNLETTILGFKLCDLHTFHIKDRFATDDRPIGFVLIGEVDD